jgi:hypothetical protein
LGLVLVARHVQPEHSGCVWADSGLLVCGEGVVYRLEFSIPRGSAGGTASSPETARSITTTAGPITAADPSVTTSTPSIAAAASTGQVSREDEV